MTQMPGVVTIGSSRPWRACSIPNAAPLSSNGGAVCALNPRCLRPASIAAKQLEQRLPSLRLRHTTRAPLVVASAAAITVDYSTPAPKPLALPWPGVKLVPLLVCISVGLVLRFLVPPPLGVTVQAWTLLAIFMSTIAGLVLEPLPVGAWAFLAVTACVATKTLTFAQAFSAFTDEALWLIVVAFFFARGFEKTGLGERVATIFVRMLGKTALGLAYGLSVAEALVAPAMPSATARAGGIFMPIIKSLSLNVGSKPGDPSRKRLGAYLVQTQLQGSANSSCMYLTGAAQNLLCMKLAMELGCAVHDTWLTWFKAAIVPAWAGLLITPILLHKFFPPEIKNMPEAPQQASERLREMGPMSRDERVMLGVMGGAVLLWVCGDMVGIKAVVTAMIGLSALLVTGVLQWTDCLQYDSAWNTLFWFSVLVGMSSQLNDMGVIAHFADAVGAKLLQLDLGWRSVFMLLNAAYFGLHYIFAAQTAHVSALYPAFLTMMMASGVPAVIGALSLGFVTDLFGCINHFASGQAAVYYGSGYLTLSEVFSYGGLMGVVNLLLWAVIGSVWWKFLGLI